MGKSTIHPPSGIGEAQPILAILFSSFGFIVQNTLYYLTFQSLSVPDKGYYRNAS
jgi:hypothetical protein